MKTEESSVFAVVGECHRWELGPDVLGPAFVTCQLEGSRDPHVGRLFWTAFCLA